MIFAYQGWDSSQNIPTQHASNAMAVMSIPIPSPPSAATTTTTSITATTTTTTTATHAPTTSTPTTTHAPMTTATAAVTSTTASTAEHTTAPVATLAPSTTAAAAGTTPTTAASTADTTEVTTTTHMQQPTTSPPPPPPTTTQIPPTSTAHSSSATTTTTTVAPLPSTTTEPTTLSIFLSVASGDLMIQLSYNSTMLWGMMAIANSYSGTFGVVSSQGMAGSMISCYGGNGVSISPTCFDLDGQNYFVTPAPNRYTTFHSASSNGSRAMMYFSAPKSRFPFLSENSLISYCYSPYDASAGLPVQHSSNDDTDHGCLSVNFVSGSVTTVSTPFSSRAMAYIIVGVILGAAILIAVVVVRVGEVQLTPGSTLFLQLSTVLLLWALVAVVVALAAKDFRSEELPIFRAFGEATAFMLSMILIPTTKHVGLGVIVGSSYERMLFLHPVLGFTVLVTMTVHMGGMFTTYDDPGDLFQDTSSLYGFIAWIFLLCVTLPAMFIRRKSYNFFRFTHCLFILVLVFGVLHHDELLVMLVPGFALWVIDLIMRLYSAVSAKARLVGLTYNKQADIVTLQLSVDWASAPKPGSYAFLLIPALSPISHPFTIALAEEVDVNDSSRRVVTFLIKPILDGRTNTFTAKLAERAKVSSSYPLTIAMFGPHGKLQVPVADCRHLVLMSGGIGVTPMMSILEHIATSIASLPMLQTLTFIWVARDQAVINFLKGTIDSLASVCARKVRVNIHFFDTSASRRLLIPPPGTEMSDISPPQLPLIGDPRISSGRPNFQKLLGTVRGEGVGCYICGPQSLNESAAKEAASRGFWIHTETFEL